MRRSILVLTLVTIVKVIMAAAPAFAPEASQQQYEVEQRSLNFELTVQGSPPTDVTFFGQGPLIGLPVQLLDPDGDGTYVGNTTIEVTVNLDGTIQPVPIAIFGGIGTNPVGTGPGSKFPGYSSLVVKDFGSTVIRDGQTLRTSISFKGPQEGATTPGPAKGDETKKADGAKSWGDASITNELPKTGGALSILGVAGGLVVASGLLVRRLTR
jgi:LPXTG-motif cell wall-anchored protein